MNIRLQRRAVTLFELLALLIIMLALSTVVLPTAQGGHGQQSLENTYDVLEAIRVATLGKYDAHKKKVCGGYVQDMGGLPRKQGTDPYYYLNALAVKPGNVLAYGKHYASGHDSDLFLFTGWRGPYYHGVNAMPHFPGDKIVDAWGNPITCTFGQYNTITSIQSPGGPEAPYNVPYPAQPIPLDYTPLTATVSGTATFGPPGNPIATVKIFHVDPETGGIMVQHVTGHLGGGLCFSFSNVPLGPAIVRARIGQPNSGSANKDTEWIDVPAGGVSGLQLHIVPGGGN
ncbi:MAG: hypothetical protein HUU29_12735 [Planctomycetaceae bacterium]|nr:hypothetical protein [Planctomycetaceae bacterium]